MANKSIIKSLTSIPQNLVRTWQHTYKTGQQNYYQENFQYSNYKTVIQYKIYDIHTHEKRLFQDYLLTIIGIYYNGNHNDY